MALPRIRQAPFSRNGLLDRRAIRAFAEAEIEKYGIRAAGSMVRTGTLSGGNLQKAPLARELAWNPLPAAFLNSTKSSPRPPGSDGVRHLDLERQGLLGRDAHQHHADGVGVRQT